MSDPDDASVGCLFDYGHGYHFLLACCRLGLAVVHSHGHRHCLVHYSRGLGGEEEVCELGAIVGLAVVRDHYYSPCLVCCRLALDGKK